MSKPDFRQLEKLPKNRYDDMLHLPHHKSSKRLPMPLADRAAQFSPFAALVGYDAAIEETARLTQERIELDENKKAMLDSRLILLERFLETNQSKDNPGTAQTDSDEQLIKVTYFEPDSLKEGGYYLTETGKLKKIDSFKKILILENGNMIPIQEIIEIEGELFKQFEENFA